MSLENVLKLLQKAEVDFLEDNILKGLKFNVRQALLDKYLKPVRVAVAELLLEEEFPKVKEALEDSKKSEVVTFNKMTVGGKVVEHVLTDDVKSNEKEENENEV